VGRSIVAEPSDERGLLAYPCAGWPQSRKRLHGFCLGVNHNHRFCSTGEDPGHVHRTEEPVEWMSRPDSQASRSSYVRLLSSFADAFSFTEEAAGRWPIAPRIRERASLRSPNRRAASRPNREIFFQACCLHQPNVGSQLPSTPGFC
jgi:hypothetical protein